MPTLPISYPAPQVIAEIGCNHKGDMQIAKELISIASLFCKADVAKFQKRHPRELLNDQQYNAPHPNAMHAYGDTYGEHREFLEFSLDQHRQLREWCGEFNIKYSTSVWDMTSAKEITTLAPELIKVGSASNSHTEMLAYLCDHYGGEIHVSLGMTTHAEEQDLVHFFEQRGRAKDVVLYSCTSGYPVPFRDVCLIEIPRIREAYGSVVKAIGFSGHHLGFAIDVAAYTLGAEWVERHFTLDRTWKGTDHSASLEPDGLRRLVRNLKAACQSLTSKQAEVLPIETVQREKLKHRQKTTAS
ncbi:MAG: N-acetylneuraminate synthase [Planctomycetaceae bacterium]|nr:N-acetylneuraminate synthase [Planctomycetaceae bacterium]